VRPNPGPSVAVVVPGRSVGVGDIGTGESVGLGDGDAVEVGDADGVGDELSISV